MRLRTVTISHRGLTLIEVVVVTAIVAVLAAITSGAFFAVRGAARRATCTSNLHQLGLAMALYRGDWGDQNPKDQVLDGPPKERLAWTLLEAYSKSKAIFRCPDEAGTSLDTLGYLYRSGPRKITERERTSLGLEPNSVTAYCMEHLRKHVVHGPFDFVEYEMDEKKQYSGRFQYLLLDSSAHSVDAKRVETWVFDGTRWYALAEVPASLNTFIRTERFPGEPWPPEFQP